MRSTSAQTIKWLACLAMMGLIACSQANCGSSSSETNNQASTAPLAASKAKAKAGGKRPIPRLKSDEVQVTQRVMPEVKAKGTDKKGDTKACRFHYTLDPTGTPTRVQPVDCDAAYLTEVTEAAIQWRFLPANGGTFDSHVRLVREVRFNLQ